MVAVEEADNDAVVLPWPPVLDGLEVCVPGLPLLGRALPLPEAIDATRCELVVLE